MDFIANHEIDRVLTRNAGTAGGTVESAFVDMANYESVTFLIQFQDVVSGAALTIRANQNTADSGSGAENIGAPITRTAGASDVDNKVVALEVKRPSKRFVRCTVGIATQNAPIDSILAIKSGPRKAPVVQGADVIDHELLVTPPAV